ncbi:helix-turn-helix transcriptional regulator [Halorubrum tebenquichense]|uniref:Transcriptional regulator, PadR-like family protein n=1 Tax=Halorubrum tebenquichense DSM 14210 TaxID=1227485 RepID=M0DYX3_9EURY|nr:helix-turn-helix transcriptional regulator [Halorubrum tebenquichense]ELZ40696.1 transcriptional regulator, PadR-like family protein [Halorubrum tebenquichense DSM 14210]
MNATTEENVVADLTGFQRDLLRSLAKADDRKGLALKTDLADYYGEEINHSRLYQNLDKLVDRGLVAKRARDRRTNEYSLTDAARDALDRRDEWVAGGDA